MPPLNHKTDVERSGKIFVVTQTTRNDERYPNDRHEEAEWLCRNLDAAITAALHVFGDDDPKVYRSRTGLMLFYEPHDDDERYTRVSVRSQAAFE